MGFFRTKERSCLYSLSTLSTIPKHRPQQLLSVTQHSGLHPCFHEHSCRMGGPQETLEWEPGHVYDCKLCRLMKAEMQNKIVVLEDLSSTICAFLFFHFLSSGSREINTRLQLECHTATLWLFGRQIISKKLIGGPLKPQYMLMSYSDETGLHKADTSEEYQHDCLSPFFFYVSLNPTLVFGRFSCY